MGRRVSGELPQVRLHKPSGNGRVCVGGREVSVGRYGSPEAHQRYLELMVEHGYLPATAIPAAKPVELLPAPLPAGNEEVPAGLTLGELCQMYLVHLDEVNPPGRKVSTRNRALAAVRAMRPLATMPAARFGKRAFLDVRQRLVETPRREQP